MHAVAFETAKRRVHFHRFMQGIHHELRELQGQADPLQIIAQRLAQDTRLVCLDEFHVTGPKTTIPLLRRVLNHSDFRGAQHDTGFVERYFGSHRPPVAMREIQ